VPYPPKLQTIAKVRVFIWYGSNSIGFFIRPILRHMANIKKKYWKGKAVVTTQHLPLGTLPPQSSNPRQSQSFHPIWLKFNRVLHQTHIKTYGKYEKKISKGEGCSYDTTPTPWYPTPTNFKPPPKSEFSSDMAQIQ